jgi:hypothetical protein
MHITAIGEQADPVTMKAFTLFTIVSDMYGSNTLVLLGIIIIFSGLWPYIRLILLLGCWFLPEKRLSSTKRGNIISFI